MGRYIVHAGCSINAEYYPVIGELKEVENWAYQVALEEFDFYAGLHGLMDFEEYCDEAFTFYDIDYDDEEAAWEDFCDYREGELIYCVKPFDETNEYHIEYLNWNKGEFIEV